MMDSVSPLDRLIVLLIVSLAYTAALVVIYDAVTLRVGVEVKMTKGLVWRPANVTGGKVNDIRQN